jgi:hypothetical protein
VKPRGSGSPRRLRRGSLPTPPPCLPGVLGKFQLFPLATNSSAVVLTTAWTGDPRVLPEFSWRATTYVALLLRATHRAESCACASSLSLSLSLCMFVCACVRVWFVRVCVCACVRECVRVHGRVPRCEMYMHIVTPLCMRACVCAHHVHSRTHVCPRVHMSTQEVKSRSGSLLKHGEAVLLQHHHRWRGPGPDHL